MCECIPAGAGEKLQYSVHPFNDNTIRFVLRYPGMLRQDVLRQAVVDVIRAVDVLHASFIARKTRAYWAVSREIPEECFTCCRTEDDPVEKALAIALEPLRADNPVQLRCSLVQGASECAVVLLASHLCVDGSDGRYLLYKLCEAYNLILSTGSSSQLQVKNGSRAPEQVYARLNRADRRRILRDPRTGIRTEFVFPTGEPGQPAVVWRHISSGVMAAAHEKAREMGATVNDLLLAACYHAYCDVAGVVEGTPVSIMSMMDLRKHCDSRDSSGLCNLTGALATALPEGVCAAFPDTLAEIARQTRRCKEDPLAGLYGMPLLHGVAKRLPMGLLVAAASHLYGSMSVGMTNIGRIDCGALRLGEITPSAGWFGGPVKRKPGLQVSVVSFDDTCTLGVWGYAQEQDKALLRQLLDRMAHYVAACAGMDG